MMEVTTKLERAGWKHYFDQVSKRLQGEQVEIELASLALGVQVIAKWLPLLGLTYEERDNTILVMAEGLDHLIRRPREVFVQTEDADLLSMEVIDEDGATEIIKFRKPVIQFSEQA